MIERFLRKSSFESMDDYRQNLEYIIPEEFNFAYDVMDAWAEEAPDKLALLWTNDKGEERRFTFGDLKKESDRVAAYLTSLGIGKGDMVMLILKRRYQFWTSIIALHKIGAVAIPATFLLTSKDIIYRCEMASIKAIICCGDEEIVEHVNGAYPKCPTLEHRISIGPEIPEGWEDFETGIGTRAVEYKIDTCLRAELLPEELHSTLAVLVVAVGQRMIDIGRGYSLHDFRADARMVVTTESSFHLR